MANYKLNQTGAQIQADLDLLDSNTGTSGQVLMANGTGGASYQNINAAAIDSGLATAGQFLVANGSGGCSWQTIPAANTESF